ncbi:MAG: DNA ligase D [Gammaproteobacteria bacterium]|nr:DNA ligase D [Gammaproteobacteria bacterium]
MSLEEYHHKRDFGKTKEPYGKKDFTKGSKLLYVIQKHAASHLHYDFRLELDGVLKSWAVPKGPSLDPKVKHLAVHVEDHPMKYANFEGIIPKGQYGGGTVMVWDKGIWEPLDDNVRKAYHSGNITFNLHGKKLQGRWKLIRLKNSPEGKRQQWLLFKINDEYSRGEAEYDIKKSAPNSADTDRSMKQIQQDKARIWTRKGEQKAPQAKIKKTRLALHLSKIKGVKKGSMPSEIMPQLATLVTDPPKGENWLHEIKWDGYRLIARIEEGKITLLTRRNNDWTYQFPALTQALKSLKFKDILLDGEVIALDKESKTNFQILQNSMEDANVDAELIYYVFDVLYYDGYNLTNLPLVERKNILQKILQSKSAVNEVKYNDHIIGNGDEVYSNACKYKLEGIISKKIDSTYIFKRTREWLKIKCTHRQEFVIGGYTDPKSSRQYFGALLLGYYNKDKKFIYCGRVGTGFTQLSLQEIAHIIKKHEQKKSAFDFFPERVTRDIHWVKPKVVAEIEFLEMTKEGILRHPSFKGLREDKKPQEVSLEQPKEVVIVEDPPKLTKKTRAKKSGSNIVFTNLDRVFYPELNLTKQDLLEYYEAAAKWIMPYIKNRPITLVRCPTGDHKKCFYQKHMNETVAGAIKSIPILEHGKLEPYIFIDDINGLMGLVQMGVLEIHPWGSNNKNVEKPDQIIFDLDPGPDVSWSEVVECAFLIRKIFEQLNLKSFVKTTGGKGLHIVIPIKPKLEWDEIRDFTKRVADLVVEIDPSKYIATMSKAKRKGKIFIDYLRNARGATAVAAYSTRARSNASISVPITWKELSKGIKPDEFNLKNIKARLKKLKTDPWKDFFETKQSITAKIKKSLGF